MHLLCFCADEELKEGTVAYGKVRLTNTDKNEIYISDYPLGSMDERDVEGTYRDENDLQIDGFLEPAAIYDIGFYATVNQEDVAARFIARKVWFKGLSPENAFGGGECVATVSTEASPDIGEVAAPDTAKNALLLELASFTGTEQMKVGDILTGTLRATNTGAQALMLHLYKINLEDGS